MDMQTSAIVAEAQSRGCCTYDQVVAYFAAKTGATMDEARACVEPMQLELVQVTDDEALLKVRVIDERLVQQYDKYMLVVDCSSSMRVQGSRGVSHLARLRALVPSIVSAVPPGASFQLVTFDTSASCHAPDVMINNYTDVAARTQERMSSDEHGGGTDGFNALLATLRHAGTASTFVLFVTDGEFNDATTFGSGGVEMNDTTIQDRIVPLLPDAPSVHLAIVGLGPTAPVLDRIADTFVYCDRTADLGATLTRLMLRSQTVASTSIHVHVETTSALRPALVTCQLPAASLVNDHTLVVNEHALEPLGPRRGYAVRRFVDHRDTEYASAAGVRWHGKYLTVADNGYLLPVVNASCDNQTTWRHEVCVGQEYHFAVHTRMEPGNSVTVRVPRIGTKIVTATRMDPADRRTRVALAVSRWRAWMAYVYDMVYYMNNDVVLDLANRAPTRLLRESLRHVTNTRTDRRSRLYAAMHKNEMLTQTITRVEAAHT